MNPIRFIDGSTNLKGLQVIIKIPCTGGSRQITEGPLTAHCRPRLRGRGGGGAADGSGNWVETIAGRSSAVGVVVEVMRLGFRVTELPMAGGFREEVVSAGRSDGSISDGGKAMQERYWSARARLSVGSGQEKC